MEEEGIGVCEGYVYDGGYVGKEGEDAGAKGATKGEGVTGGKVRKEEGLLLCSNL